MALNKNGRCIYAGVAEVSIYVAERATGRGLGKMLLKELIQETQRLLDVPGGHFSGKQGQYRPSSERWVPHFGDT